MNLRLCQYFRKCIATCMKTSSGCFRKSSRTNANSCRKFQWKNNNVLRKWDLEKNVSLQVLIALQCSKPLLQRMYHIVNAFRTFSIFKRNSAWRPQYSFIFFFNDTYVLLLLLNIAWYGPEKKKIFQCHCYYVISSASFIISLIDHIA